MEVPTAQDIVGPFTLVIRSRIIPRDAMAERDAPADLAERPGSAGSTGSMPARTSLTATKVDRPFLKSLLPSTLLIPATPFPHTWKSFPSRNWYPSVDGADSYPG